MTMAQRMFRTWLWLVLLSLIWLLALAHAEEAPKLDETVALRLQLLATERALLESQAQRLVDQYAAKGRELDAIMEAEAVRAGVKLSDGWRPDLARRVWVKSPPPK